MGLLTRARNLAAEMGQRADSSLDEMAKVLCARISRLPPKTTTPYTALSLLKAYGSFQSGACLILKDGVYTSYTSVAMGIAKISIPQEEVWSVEKTKMKFFKYQSGWEALLKDEDDGFDYWIFPLECPGSPNLHSPWEAVMFLGVLHSDNFHADSISAIVSQTSEKFLTHDACEKTEIPDHGSTEFISPELDSAEAPFAEISPILKNRIAHYHRAFTDFGCILFENSGNEANTEDLCQKIMEMVGSTANVIPLEDRPLILLPPAIDREIIAHRLSENLKITALLSFEAHSPENALSQIHSLF